MNMKYGQTGRTRQSGTALIIALIFLLLMTVLSTSSMRNSMMQERMTGHMRDWQLGFQSAEAGLRAAEKYLSDTAVLPAFNGTNGLYQVNAANRPMWTGSTPSDGNGYAAYPETVPYVAQQPKYFIEQLDSIRPAGTETETGTPVTEIYFYRVTAVGFGGAVDGSNNPLSSVVLSTVFRSR
ncbi:MAG: pilus assembly PilX family protein [Woeseiaceae bacterium]